MFSNIIDFFIDYFTHLNTPKIIGGIIFLIGIFLLGSVTSSGDTSKATLFAVGGIFVGGIGAIIISYDIAKDKNEQNYNELETFSRAYKHDSKDQNQDLH